MSTPQESNTSKESADTPKFKDWRQNMDDDDLSFINPDGWLAISQSSQSQECSQYDCFAMYNRPKQSSGPLQCKQAQGIVTRSEQINPCHAKEESGNKERRSMMETEGREVDRRRVQQILKMEIQGWSLRLACNARIQEQIRTNPQRSNEQIARKLHLEHNFQ